MPKPLIIGETNLDADQLVFFKRQLEHIKSKSYDVKYPNLMATSVIPVSTEAGPGAESITYEQFDSVGITKFISDYADDLPRSDVKGKQFSILIQSLGGSYGWSMQEVRAAGMAKRNINSMRAMAARRSNDEMVNRIAWFGDGTAAWAGLNGILGHPNVPELAAPTGDWEGSGVTADQIISDFGKGVQKIIDDTKGVEYPDTFLCPDAQYAKMATMPRASTSDTTVLEFLNRVYPRIKIAAVNELASVPAISGKGWAANDDVGIFMRRSPDALQLELPVIYEQFAAQERNLAFVVPCHSRIAGINLYYPLSMLILFDI